MPEIMFSDYALNSCFPLHILCLQDMKKFETEVKALHTALEQAQATLTSPEIGRLSLKEQLSQRQVNQSYQGDTTCRTQL